MKRLEGSEGSAWTGNWTTLGRDEQPITSIILCEILDPEIQAGEPGFQFHQSLGFNES